MIRFYFNLAPNPRKVALFLEEAGPPCEPFSIDTGQREEHAPAIVALDPSAKAPAIVADDGTVVFDPNAIRRLLAEKRGVFLPSPERRAAPLAWLTVVATGIALCSRQPARFETAGREFPDGIDRDRREAQRRVAILDAKRRDGPFLPGEIRAIADMALWGRAPFPSDCEDPPCA